MSTAGKYLLALTFSILLLGGALANSATSAAFTEASIAYRSDDLQRARQLLEAILDDHPEHNDAAMLLAFVEYRQGNHQAASERFERLVGEGGPDALYGLALSHRGLGNLDAARAYADAARRADGSRSDIESLLESLGERRRPRPLSRYERSLSLEVPFTATDGAFRDASGRTIPIKGVNLGLALPGRFPSQFPRGVVRYREWLSLIAGMNANAVRLYTIVPPEFYQALREHNLAHPDRQLYLLQGVWTELPVGDEYRGEFTSSFLAEARRAVDVVHGNAALPERRGHAHGTFDHDVSRWLLGFILGREWEPYSVSAFEKLAATDTEYEGEYLECAACSPMEAWLARVMDSVTSYQTTAYNQQTPIAFTNWPTLDPLHHPTESTREEEDALRVAAGEPDSAGAIVEYNNDEVSVDSTRIRATSEFEAGHFASYHAYPYYPDFMNNDPDYLQHSVSPYQGYLEELAEHHGDQPVVIAEFGVPSSRLNAHANPSGYDHGGHSELEQARIDVELDRQIRETGLAGAVLFAWLDEWFKRNWLVLDLELPAESLPRWHSVQNPEENYGVVGTNGHLPPLGSPLEDWPGLAVVARGEAADLSASRDEQYLHLFLDGTDIEWPVRFQLDTHPAPGNEFLVALTAESGYLRVNAGYQPFKLQDTASPWARYRFDPLLGPAPGSGWLSWMTEPNRRRYARDGTSIPGTIIDSGRLTPGEETPEARDPTSDYFVSEDFLHLRLPWGLILVGDPSTPAVRDGTSGDGWLQVDSVGITVPTSFGDLAGRFELEGWREPEYELRLKPVYEAFRQYWGGEVQ